jgi:hypothetical protein
MALVEMFPSLDDERYLRLFHIAAHHTWTAATFDWSLPDGLGPRERMALARLITPIYLGEQTAMLGGAEALRRMAEEKNASAQVYLASFLMDEARHFEALTKLYHLLGHHPIRLREMPDMLRYHHRMRMGRTALHWVLGILVSDIFARTFYGTFARTRGSFLFGRLSARIVVDEGRHQAFAEHYLSDHLPTAARGLRDELVALKEDLLRIVARLGVQLKDDAEALGIRGEDLFEAFAEEVQQRAHRVGLRCGGCPHAQRPVGTAAPIPPSCANCFVVATLAGLAGGQRPPEPAPAAEPDRGGVREPRPQGRIGKSPPHNR